MNLRSLLSRSYERCTIANESCGVRSVPYRSSAATAKRQQVVRTLGGKYSRRAHTPQRFVYGGACVGQEER